MSNQHIPVLLDEALEALEVTSDLWYIDATFGGGGHTKAILDRGGKVLAFDRDPAAIKLGKEHFSTQSSNLILVNGNFSTISEVVNIHGVAISGVLFDFGTSTMQLKSSERGFSFDGDGPLDMRMNPELGVQAKDLLAVLPENQLAHLFQEFGGEEQAKAIAKAIKRAAEPVVTVTQLRDLIVKVKRSHRGNLHPATKVFQALRIAVNSELDHISDGIMQAFEVLESGGHIVSIAFHEGEDRIIKHQFKVWSDQSVATLGPRLKPSPEEISSNPRSRSAVLRSLTKI